MRDRPGTGKRAMIDRSSICGHRPAGRGRTWRIPDMSTSPVHRIRSMFGRLGSAGVDCPSDASGTRAIRFGYDPSISRDGTMVAGHPAILTLLIDDSGHVTGLQIGPIRRRVSMSGRRRFCSASSSSRVMVLRAGPARKDSRTRTNSRWVDYMFARAAQKTMKDVRLSSSEICSG